MAVARLPGRRGRATGAAPGGGGLLAGVRVCRPDARETDARRPWARLGSGELRPCPSHQIRRAAKLAKIHDGGGSRARAGMRRRTGGREGGDGAREGREGGGGARAGREGGDDARAGGRAAAAHRPRREGGGGARAGREGGGGARAGRRDREEEEERRKVGKKKRKKNMGPTDG